MILFTVENHEIRKYAKNITYSYVIIAKTKINGKYWKQQ